ncbi:hypothetical protein M407DRAFT_190261 [Tulasnella calospora MUT 4182]|uniref:Uncharacterized protein n=1 Tax=Tulasnella calospora MUT 4182 TaxID=1051891 RepID=A0A0C3QLK7_9AGAM|nr:hypothetical protein M407DRAFT_190261 [Tulasnella calospora MUT 4182]
MLLYTSQEVRVKQTVKSPVGRRKLGPCTWRLRASQRWVASLCLDHLLMLVVIFL